MTLSDTVGAIFNIVNADRREWLCTVNVAVLMMMCSDSRLQGFIDRSAVVVADGQPIICLARLLGCSLPERVTGVDLVDAICERAARDGKRIYLLGATDSVVAKVAERQRSRFPGIQVDYSDGFFSADSAANRADRIRSSGAAILFVGMGVPRQEKFIEEQWDRLGVNIAIGVGGSFDVLSGLRARAPRWMQQIGVEWFFRLIQEPRRLFLRYLVTNSQFVWLAFLAVLSGKRGS